MCHFIVGAVGLLGCEGSGGCGLVGAALSGLEDCGHRIGYDNKDGRQRHKRGGVDIYNKQ